MKHFNSVIIFTFILALMSLPAFAQETQETVVDEVIAQVNDDVITLSQIKREMKIAVDGLIEQGKSREEAEAEVANRKGQLIASVITEELIAQKGKEVGLDKQVEATINQRFLQQMQNFNLNSLDELFAAMRQQGIDPEEIRRAWKPQIMNELVYSELVDRALYWDITDKDLKDYYEKNKGKFTTPASLTLSEIFLSFAGKNEADVRAKAKQIVESARKGEDFGKLAVENSERPDAGQNSGKVGSVPVENLSPLFAEALKDKKAGYVSDPIELDVGLEILRIDEKTEASSTSSFDENAVRLAILKERAPEARKKFIRELKQDAYIKIREEYRPVVTPFLNEPATTTSETTASK